MSIDKLDVVEALVEVLDGVIVPGLGLVAAGADSRDEGTVVIQTWPIEGGPSFDFLCRVTRYHHQA